MSSPLERLPIRSQQADAARFASLEGWLRWQEKLHFTAIELGLERCRRVAGTMDLLHPRCHVLSVAGTNGKGSSVELLRLVLSHAGYRVGCYTSPHLLRYNERVTINGEQVSDACLCRSFARIDQARGEITLTYFEFGTLAALDIFRREQVDIAILEVGLGGRLDAVNILDADTALITSIDLDHQQWLGHDRERIAREKAGILRHRAPAVCSDPSPPQSLLDCAQALGTPLFVLGREFSYQQHGDSWDWYSASACYRELPSPTRHCDYQVQNAAGVLMVLEQLAQEYPVTEEALRHGLHGFHPPGRFQIIPGKCQTVLDVAHNQRAAQVLVESLQRLPRAGATHIVLGLFKDKDRQAVYHELAKVADRWHLVSLPGARGCAAQLLAAELAALGVGGAARCHEQVADALREVFSDAVCGDSVVVSGSFVAVGGALRFLLPRAS